MALARGLGPASASLQQVRCRKSLPPWKPYAAAHVDRVTPERGKTAYAHRVRVRTIPRRDPTNARLLSRRHPSRAPRRHPGRERPGRFASCVAQRRARRVRQPLAPVRGTGRGDDVFHARIGCRQRRSGVSRCHIGCARCRPASDGYAHVPRRQPILRNRQARCGRVEHLWSSDASRQLGPGRLRFHERAHRLRLSERARPARRWKPTKNASGCAGTSPISPSPCAAA